MPLRLLRSTKQRHLSTPDKLLSLSHRRVSNILITEIKISVPKLPTEFENYKIVQLTDLHFGKSTSESHINKTFQLTNELNPDLVCVTGDLIQLSRLAVDRKVIELFGPNAAKWREHQQAVREKTIKLGELFQTIQCRDGIVGVFGNHDYKEGIRHFRKNIQIRWLVNDCFEIKRGQESILISGVDDYRKGKPNLKRITNLLSDKESFRLLLSHNPDIALHAEQELIHKHDLVLAGHTHGGQICLPFWGPIITRTKQKKHIKGLSYHKSPNNLTTPFYTSHGIGCGLVDLRLFCPAEIVVVKLHKSS
jgi:predicted MPP superfamily phosphohydrolase